MDVSFGSAAWRVAPVNGVTDGAACLSLAEGQP
jgi:hypothetical protein